MERERDKEREREREREKGNQNKSESKRLRHTKHTTVSSACAVDFFKTKVFQHRRDCPPTLTVTMQSLNPTTFSSIPRCFRIALFILATTLVLNVWFGKANPMTLVVQTRCETGAAETAVSSSSSHNSVSRIIALVTWSSV